MFISLMGGVFKASYRNNEFFHIGRAQFFDCCTTYLNMLMHRGVVMTWFCCKGLWDTSLTYARIPLTLIEACRPMTLVEPS